jgi:hypothetical protein
MRFGWSLTGKSNHPATAEATGLEVDKYDAAAVERYMRHYLAMYRDVVGADMMGARGIRNLLTDSIEVGASNWTPRMLEEFRQGAVMTRCHGCPRWPGWWWVTPRNPTGSCMISARRWPT